MTETNISIIQETKEKIIKLLIPSGWADKLRIFLNGTEMDVLLEKLFIESKEERHFTPTLKDVFNAFIQCPFDRTKLVILGQDPYPTINVADGIAFSCSKTPKIQPSLRYILNAVNKTVYDGNKEEQNKDLTRWANQGVLCLNAALTCRIDKPATHYEIWKDFIFMVIDALQYHNPTIPYILMGKYAQGFSSYISYQSPVLKIAHPASAAYAKHNDWDCQDCFNWANKVLSEKNMSTIVW